MSYYKGIVRIIFCIIDKLPNNIFIKKEGFSFMVFFFAKDC